MSAASDFTNMEIDQFIQMRFQRTPMSPSPRGIPVLFYSIYPTLSSSHASTITAQLLPLFPVWPCDVLTRKVLL